MKLSPSIFALCLIFLTLVSAAAAQGEKDKNSVSKAVELKLNLMALKPDNKFAEDVKPEDVRLFEDGVEQKITYFSRKEPVLNVGLLFDNSGSMRESLNEIISAGKVIVANLNPNDEAFVLRFIDSANIEVIQDWTSNTGTLNQAIDNLFVQGGQTAVLDALYLSAQKIQERAKTDKSKHYAIVLFSDAEERDSYYKFADVAKMFEETDIQIYLLSYAESAPLQKKKAKKLADRIPLEIGGMAYTLPRRHGSPELLNALKAIVTEIRSNYVVGYTSTNQKRDGKPRKLTVQIADGANGEKRQGTIRDNFVVPKN